MLPDLNRLKVFYHIFTEGSSTAAARALNLTQSGVSQHLKKLEDELQVSLFTRVNRRLVPTTAGVELYGIVENFLLALEGGVRQLGESQHTPSGLLRLGAPSEFGAAYLPAILASFRRKYRDVSFQLELQDPRTLFDMVSSGELDFAYIDILPIIHPTPDGLTSYTIEPLVTEELVLACSREYYEEHVAGAGYDELLQLSYISYKKDIALFRSWFSLHYSKEPAIVNLALVADSARTIISAIQEGLGLGIIVSHLISEKLSEGEIVRIGDEHVRLENTIASVRLKNKKMTMTEQSFQTFFRDKLRCISNLWIRY